MGLSPTRSETVRRKMLSREDIFSEVQAFLKSGTPWPGEPPPECIESHASLVYLTRDTAWKLKKPVRLVHVDQVSLEARARLCHEELRLNRELAGKVYRGLTPIFRQPDGSLALGGRGCIVDWLIEIDRLPAREMLDRRIAFGPEPQLAEIEAFCDVLVKFYRHQPTPPEAGGVFHRRLMQDSQIAATHLSEMTCHTHVPAPEQALNFVKTVLYARRKEIIERGRQGFVVEAHGDLRAEHVCLSKPPVVFDRLEINHGIRLLDPFYEINGLGLECASMGAGWIRAVLLAKLSEAIAPPSRDLLSAYGAVAFLTRARIAADHFRDAEVATPEKWCARTKQCLSTAEQLVAQAGRL